MATFTLTSDRKLTSVDPFLGVQFDNNASPITVNWPSSVIGVDVTDFTTSLVVENFPIIEGITVKGTPNVTTFPLTENYTQKAGTLSIQLVLSNSDQSIVIRSELTYGKMSRSQTLGDESTSKYPTILTQVSSNVARAEAASQTATDSVENSEAWATGTRGGTEVPSSDATYHNNAKYYSDSALSSKSSAESARDSAITAKGLAESASSSAISAKTASESARDASVTAKTASESARDTAAAAKTAAQTAQTASESARDASVAAKTAAQTAQAGSESARDASVAAKTAAQTAQAGSEAARDASVSAKTSAETASSDAATAKTAAQTAQAASESARDASVVAKTAAQTAQTASESARDASVTAKTASESARDTAVAAKTAAQTAQTASEAAMDASVAAKTSAETASSDATTAKTAAQTAQTASESARDDSVAAKTAAQSAQTAAENARDSAVSSVSSSLTNSQNSEAWAVGQKGGADVGTGDSSYHNNAKYYSEQAALYSGGLSVVLETTLTAAGWSNSQRTITHDNIKARNTIDMVPGYAITLEQAEALQGAIIIETAQAVGSMTIKALGDVPTIDIPVIFIFHSDN